MNRRADFPLEPIDKAKAFTVWRVWRQAEGRRVEVKVWIATRREAGLEDGDVWFFAEATLADGVSVREEDKNLYALHRNVIAIVADSVPVAWEGKLLVTMRSQTPMREDDNDGGAGLLCSYEPVQLGKAGGKRFRRRSEGDRIETGWPGTGELEGGWKDSDARSVSLIPDTPENRAALNHIIQGIEKVSARLREIMSPTNIIAAIAAATAGLPLLPDAPSEK